LRGRPDSDALGFERQLVTRLSNALYGSALAHVMTAEIAVAQSGSDTGYRHEAWQAARATGEGIAILLHYTAMRLAGRTLQRYLKPSKEGTHRRLDELDAQRGTWTPSADELDARMTVDAP
jgi:hypothetical protein